MEIDIDLDETAGVVQPIDNSGSDSDDLLVTIKDKHVSDRTREAEAIFSEEDSPSTVLPVPKHL